MNYKMGNMSCVLKELRMVDDDMELDLEAMLNSIKDMNIRDTWLLQQTIEDTRTCYAVRKHCVLYPLIRYLKEFCTFLCFGQSFIKGSKTLAKAWKLLLKRLDAMDTIISLPFKSWTWNLEKYLQFASKLLQFISSNVRTLLIFSSRSCKLYSKVYNNRTATIKLHSGKLRFIWVTKKDKLDVVELLLVLIWMLNVNGMTHFDFDTI